MRVRQMVTTATNKGSFTSSSLGRCQLEAREKKQEKKQETKQEKKQEKLNDTVDDILIAKSTLQVATHGRMCRYGKNCSHGSQGSQIGNKKSSSCIDEDDDYDD